MVQHFFIMKLSRSTRKNVKKTFANYSVKTKRNFIQRYRFFFVLQKKNYDIIRLRIRIVKLQTQDFNTAGDEQIGENSSTLQWHRRNLKSVSVELVSFTTERSRSKRTLLRGHLHAAGLYGPYRARLVMNTTRGLATSWPAPTIP